MQGLQNKYIVQKTSGRPIEPEARYFVLRYDNDKDALAAAMLWASLKGNWALFDDLKRFVVSNDAPTEELGDGHG